MAINDSPPPIVLIIVGLVVLLLGSSFGAFGYEITNYRSWHGFFLGLALMVISACVWLSGAWMIFLGVRGAYKDTFV